MKHHRLMNLIVKNLETPGKRFEVVNKDSDEATIYLYDVIDDWYGVSAQAFVKELNEITAGTINLRINSPGGDVFAGRAINTALKQHKSKVIAHIDGLAASAATYVALGANEVRMSDGAFFMIHKGWTYMVGNADDCRTTADLLDKVDQSIANDYAKKTGIETDELISLMAAETWFTAEEAKEKGFVDAVFDGDAVSNAYDLSEFSHAPEKIQQPENQTTVNFKFSGGLTDDDVSRIAATLRAELDPEEEPAPTFNARTPYYKKLNRILEQGNA